MLFFLNDLNDWRWKRSWLRLSFPLGAMILTAVVLIECLQNPAPVDLIWRIVFGIVGLMSFWLLLRALIFDLPTGQAYITQEDARPVCRSGVYALCRHPGVLFSGLLLFCLSLAAGLPIASALMYFLLNILLGFFEDRVVFPAVLSGWPEYRQTTPFLLPSPKSIRAVFHR